MTSYGRCLTPSDVAARISGPNYILLRTGTFLRRHLASPIKPQAVMDGLLQPTCARSKAWIDHWCSGFLSIWLRVCMVCVLYALGKLFCSPNSNTHHHIKKATQHLHRSFASVLRMECTRRFVGWLSEYWDTVEVIEHLIAFVSCFPAMASSDECSLELFLLRFLAFTPSWV